MSSIGTFIETMHSMMVAFTTLQENFQAHFQTLVEEVVLGVASEVVASEVVELAAVGNNHIRLSFCDIKQFQMTKDFVSFL